MGSAFELLCVVQKRAAALRKKIDKSHMGLRRQKRKAERPIVKKYPQIRIQFKMIPAHP